MNFNKTAIVIYDYLIEYKMQGKDFKSQTKEAFILSKEKEKWLAIWRIINI